VTPIRLTGGRCVGRKKNQFKISNCGFGAVFPLYPPTLVSGCRRSVLMSGYGCFSKLSYLGCPRCGALPDSRSTAHITHDESKRPPRLPADLLFPAPLARLCFFAQRIPSMLERDGFKGRTVVFFPLVSPYCEDPTAHDRPSGLFKSSSLVS